MERLLNMCKLQQGDTVALGGVLLAKSKTTTIFSSRRGVLVFHLSFIPHLTLHLCPNPHCSPHTLLAVVFLDKRYHEGQHTLILVGGKPSVNAIGLEHKRAWQETQLKDAAGAYEVLQREESQVIRPVIGACTITWR
jgi:hypothetical protein